MNRILSLIFFVFLTLSSSVFAAPAVQGKNGKAGEFDYYVLALSWSPSYCLGGQARDGDKQCDATDDKKYGLVVHGLWSQYYDGYPFYCAGKDKQQVDRVITGKMLDYIPSAGLINHQWNKHGTCSGLDQMGYFTLIEKQFKNFTVPEVLQGSAYKKVKVADLKQSWVDNNSDFTNDSLSVTCRGQVLQEIRLCYDKDMNPKKCGQNEKKQACKKETVLIPPAF